MQPVSRIGYIDGLRAIAVLSVVLNHAAKYAHPVMSLPVRVLLQGHHGVELFFVISGFCLAHPTLDRIHETGMASFDIVRYAAKRMVRILPPYYIALVLFAVVGTHVASGDLVRQALFMDNGTHLVNTSFWTLAVEFRWYFFFPVALLLWVRAPRAFLALLAGVYVLNATYAFSLDVELLPLFLLGIVAADIAIRKPAWAMWSLVALAVALIAAFALTPSSDSGGFTGIHWHIVAFLTVIAAGAFRTLRSALSALTTVGAASYSLYLVNEPIILSLERAGLLPWLAIIVALGAGFAFWLVAERPFVETKLRDRLLRTFTEPFGRWFRVLGVPASMTLQPQAALRTPKLAAIAGALEPRLRNAADARSRTGFT